MDQEKYLWASPHNPTPDQIADLESRGEIVYLKDVDPELFEAICNCPENPKELLALASILFSRGLTYYAIVQPGGSPAFQFLLGRLEEKYKVGISIWYAHTKRISEDIEQPDGSIKKVSVFKHEGWTKV